ncbi:MAG: hypothetical protein KBF74_07150 [Ferruginibacter sp.]|nr:hypothetical protein [Ferruginibacter sp.]
MTIAVHISFPGNNHDLTGNFNFQCFSILAARYPDYQFIFLFDKPVPPGIITTANIKTVHVSPAIRNNLLQHFWYNFKLPSFIKKYNAVIFAGNGPVCSLRTGINQCIVVNDTSFLDKNNRNTSGEARYLKKHFKKFVEKATVVAATSSHVLNTIIHVCPKAIDKVRMIGRGLPAKTNLTDHMGIQKFKEAYTGGKEYFLAFITDTSIQNTTMLLKAFSAFKKMQLSNMKLLLLISSVQKENIVKDFDNYKYRNDVIFVIAENEEQVSQFIAAAYAAIYLPVINAVEDHALLPLIYEVPVITANNDFLKGIFCDAAVYSQPAEQHIAEKMMLLYKDENFRNGLVESARLLAKAYTWEKTATNLWQSLTGSATQTA